MFTREELDRILFAPIPAPAPHTAEGHSAVAEQFRLRALIAMETARITLANLECLIRDFPADDARFDAAAEAFNRYIIDTGTFVQAFRETRTIVGEA